MVVIFVFIAITINIGNIAQEKTMISNASDGAALLLASTLGSLANALRVKLGLTGDDVLACDIDFSMILMIFALIASIAVAIATFGAGTPFVVAVIGLIISAGFFGLGMYNALKAEPGVMQQAELKFQSMTLEQRMKEKALQYALFALTSDPNKICNKGTAANPIEVPGDPGDPKLDPTKAGPCIDRNDLDMNGSTTNCIHWFGKWYNDRLNALPRLGDIVESLQKKIFVQDTSVEKAPIFYVLRDPETWQVKKGEGYDYNNGLESGFWIDTNFNGKTDPGEGGTLRINAVAITSDDEHDTKGVVYAHDVYFLDWLDKRFKKLVTDLNQYGYGLYDLTSSSGNPYYPGYPYSYNFEQYVLLGNIHKLNDEITDFQKEVSALYGATYESRLESFDDWLALFYNGTQNKQDWYKRMQGWIDIVEGKTGQRGWITLLIERRDQINEHLDSCAAKGPYQCGLGGKGDPWCSSYCKCDCFPCPEESNLKSGGGSGSAVSGIAWSAAGSHSGRILLAGNAGCSCPACGSCTCEWLASCGCGPEQGGGKFCPRGGGGPCEGRPKYKAPTPTAGNINCCDSTLHVHYQLCDAGSYSTGGNGPCDGPCEDTYYDCGVDHNLNFITREHAIDYLTQFVREVKALQAAFKKAYDDALPRNNDPRFYEVLYSWVDRVAKSTAKEQKPGEQLVRHIVYVSFLNTPAKIETSTFKSVTISADKIFGQEIRHTNPDPEYKFPYIHNDRKWSPLPFPPYVLPEKCMSVASSYGSFVITVARYDEDVGTAPTSPLRNLWIFKSRQSPAGGFSSVPENILNGIQNPPQCAYTYDPNGVNSPKLTNAFCVDPVAAQFVLDNGVISKTEGHYGPGLTYEKDQMKWDTNTTTAAQRNRDIYIKRLR